MGEDPGNPIQRGRGPDTSAALWNGAKDPGRGPADPSAVLKCEMGRHPRTRVLCKTLLWWGRLPPCSPDLAGFCGACAMQACFGVVRWEWALVFPHADELCALLIGLHALAT